MFVAQVEGHSMDDGKSGLVNGCYAVFELWPSGTRQDLNVLVRGAFADPETGSYAVKKYVADQRDADGRHGRISLVSLNPDKTRFPDILLDPDRDDDVAVVAKVVQALSADQLVRRPRPLRRPGRRDLRSPEAIADIARDLAAHTELFFQDPASAEPEPEKARALWRAELVCLDAEAGGLHIEVGPLAGLWSFVKQLKVRGVGWDATISAVNPRLRAVRIAADAASGPWAWDAVGFEDDPDVDLGALALSAPASDGVTVFRTDASGVGRAVANRRISAGQHYLILIPPTVLAVVPGSGLVASIRGGWGLWDLDLASAPAPAAQALVRELDLDLGESEARLEWVLVPPTSWATSSKGVDYPRFLSEPAPVLLVAGPGVERPGSASLYLHGQDGHRILPLPAGDSHLVRLEGLLPGRYVALVLHDRTAIAAERLVFEVVAAADGGPSASWRVSLNGVFKRTRGGPDLGVAEARPLDGSGCIGGYAAQDRGSPWLASTSDVAGSGD